MSYIKAPGKQEIPIFFSSDDNYIPFLDVAIASLIDNASKEYKYRIVVLHTGLARDNVDRILQNQRENFTTNCCCWSGSLSWRSSSYGTWTWRMIPKLIR